MKKLDIVELDITAYGSNGEGIGVSEGMTVFVPYTCVGDKVQAQIAHIKGTVAFGILKKVVKKSKNRVDIECKVFGKCGGCQLMQLNYFKQLELKRDLVSKNFKKIGGIDCEILPVVESEQKFCYRNKLQLPFGVVDGKVVCGFYKNNSHEIAPIDSCILQGEWASKLIEIVKNWAIVNDISIYDEATKKGLLRHLVARYIDKQLLVTLVINGENIGAMGHLEENLRAEFGDRFGLFININKNSNNVIMGEKTKYISGLKYISAQCLGINFDLQPNSFFQINDSVREKMFQSCIGLLNQNKCEVLIDAFSGIGIMSAALCSDKYITFAIEIEKDAVDDADKIKELNGIVNLKNICGDVRVELPKLISDNQDKNISIIFDPPRKGLNSEIIETIIKCKPQQIIYISCDSATLSRDLKDILATNNYDITFCQPFDMFPMTRHVETLCCLRLKETIKG